MIIGLLSPLSILETNDFINNDKKFTDIPIIYNGDNSNAFIAIIDNGENTIEINKNDAIVNIAIVIVGAVCVGGGGGQY